MIACFIIKYIFSMLHYAVLAAILDLKFPYHFREFVGSYLSSWIFSFNVCSVKHQYSPNLERHNDCKNILKNLLQSGISVTCFYIRKLNIEYSKIIIKFISTIEIKISQRKFHLPLLDVTLYPDTGQAPSRFINSKSCLFYFCFASPNQTMNC